MRDTFTRRWKRTFANFNLLNELRYIHLTIGTSIARLLKIDYAVGLMLNDEIDAKIPLQRMAETEGRISQLVDYETEMIQIISQLQEKVTWLEERDTAHGNDGIELMRRMSELEPADYTHRFDVQRGAPAATYSCSSHETCGATLFCDGIIAQVHYSGPALQTGTHAFICHNKPKEETVDAGPEAR